MFPKKELAQLIISACCQIDIDTVIISPGSRNAPLTIGFCNHPKIKALSVVDERCAAFFALGISQQTRKPTALVCTSGSALLNYYPAIAEAFYSNIPLVVISADRPKHMIDIGDGQAIRQENIFKSHILFSANMVDDHRYKKQNVALIDKCLKIAALKKGPVHINVPFDEPLYEVVDKYRCSKLAFENKAISALKTKEPQVSFKELAEIWNASKRKMILIGVHYPDEKIQQLLTQLTNDKSVLVLIESTSNLHHHKFINAIDQLIFSMNDEQYKEFQPEILITFGGMIISKKIKHFLRNYQPKHHWHIDEYKARDTFFCLSRFVQQKPIVFLTKFYAVCKSLESDYQQKWLEIRDQKRIKHKHYIKGVEHSDFKVLGQVLESVPKNSQLQVSNSSMIRYVQLFTLEKSVEVYSNRGTSGIDGSTSTAIGASFACRNQTVFVTGDISFFYDSNALWNASIKRDFRIILINNSGGGIFRIISGPKDTNAIEYFETPHSLTAEHLCRMYGFEYQSAKDTLTAKQALENFYAVSSKPKLLEIFTPSSKNDAILKNYFKYIH